MSADYFLKNNKVFRLFLSLALIISLYAPIAWAEEPQNTTTSNQSEIPVSEVQPVQDVVIESDSDLTIGPDELIESDQDIIIRSGGGVLIAGGTILDAARNISIEAAGDVVIAPTARLNSNGMVSINENSSNFAGGNNAIVGASVQMTSEITVNDNQSLELLALPNRPTVEITGYSATNRTQFPGYARFIPIDKDNFKYSYDVGAAAGATVDATISKAGQTLDLSTEPVEIGIGRVNDAQGSEGIPGMTVLFVDDQDNVFTVPVVLTTDVTTHTFDLTSTAAQAAGLDATKIARIVLRLNYEALDPDFDTQQLERRGEIFVNVEGLDLPFSNNTTAFDATKLTTLPSDSILSAQGINTGSGSVPGFVNLVTPFGDVNGFRYDVGGSEGATVQATIERENGNFRNVGSSLTVAMKANAAGTRARVRAFDASGKTQYFEFTLSDQFENHILSFDLADDFDFTNIDRLVIEMDRGLTAERTGQIDFYLPVHDVLNTFDANALQVFPAETIIETQGTNSGSGTIPGFVTALTPAGDIHGFRYDVGGATDSIARATIKKPSAAFVNQLQDPLGLGMRNTVPGTKVRIIATDVNNKTRTFVVRVSDSFQLVSLDFDSPTGTDSTVFDIDNVSSLVFEIDRSMATDNAGDFHRRGQLEFYLPEADPFELLTPVITSVDINSNGVGIVDFADVPGAAVYMVEVASDPLFENVVHTGFPTSSLENFNVTTGGEYFVRVRGSASSQIEVGPLTRWSDRSRDVATVIQDEAAELTAVTGSDFTGLTTVDFEPVPGAVIYQVQVASDPDFNNIIRQGFPTTTQEVLPADFPNGTFYVRVRGSGDNDIGAGFVSQWSNVIQLDRNFQGLAANPSILDSGIPNYFIAPKVTPVGISGNASITNKGVSITYDTDAVGFSGGGISYVEDGGTAKDLSHLSEINLGIQGDVSRVKFEIHDADDNVSFGFLNGIEAGTEKRWSIPVSEFSGVDFTRVSRIFVIVEGAGKQGTLDLTLLPYVANDDTASAAELTELPAGADGSVFRTSLGSGGDSSDSVIDTDRGVEITFNTGTAAGSSGGFAGGGFSFDNFGTNPIGTSDLSGLEELLFEVKSDVSELKLEFVDGTGKSTFVRLHNISSTEERIYRIPTSLLSDVDLTKMRIIYFIAEGHDKSGKITVNHIPELAPNPLLGPSDVVDFTNGRLGSGELPLITIAGADGTASLTPEGDRAAVFNFFTGTAGFAGAGISYDNFGTPEEEAGDLSSTPFLRLGIKGSMTDVQLVIEDYDGGQEKVFLTGVTDSEQVWDIPMLLFSGLNLTNIKNVFLLVEGQSLTGSFTLYYEPLAV